MATKHKKSTGVSEISDSSVNSMLAFINRQFSHLFFEGRHVIGMEYLEGNKRLLTFVNEMKKLGTVTVNLQC